MSTTITAREMALGLVAGLVNHLESVHRCADDVRRAGSVQDGTPGEAVLGMALALLAMSEEILEEMGSELTPGEFVAAVARELQTMRETGVIRSGKVFIDLEPETLH